MTKTSGATYSAARIENRVRALGREISRGYHGRRLHVVVTMDRGFVFAADLVRAIDVPVVLHFLREDIRDIDQGGQARREVFFANRAGMTSGNHARPEWQGRDVLLVDAVIDSGITQDFLLRRIGEGKPRSLRLAVLLDKTSRRRVALEPDYFAFRTASNLLWSGYGLARQDGTGGNGKQLAAGKAVDRRAKSQRGRSKSRVPRI